MMTRGRLALLLVRPLPLQSPQTKAGMPVGFSPCDLLRAQWLHARSNSLVLIQL